MDGSRTQVGRPSWGRELTQILFLAAPLAAAQLAQMGMGITDTVMMGRVSSEALAAGGLGANVAFLLIIVGQGLVASIQPIVAQARGAADHSGFGRTLAAGLIVSVLASIPIVLILTHIDVLLDALAEPARIGGLALDYERAFAWGVPAGMLQFALRNYLSALERPRIIMAVVMTAFLANLGLNWVLVFGHLGFPALGLGGAGYATAIVWWGMFASFALYLHRARLVPADLFRLGWAETGRGLGAVLELGWPIAGSYLVECGLFSASSVLMGWFGPVALAAHQICLNISSFTFMVPLAISQAATVRVGFHVGSGELPRARVAGFAALALGTGFMLAMAAVITSLSQPLFHVYLDAADPDLDAVLALGGQMIVLAALFQMFDGAQVVAAGALRGLQDTKAALIVGAFGYWGLGMPIGAGLAFGLGLGPIGLWWGFVGGLVAVALPLSLRFGQRMGRMIAAGSR
jgi:MATE family multidrug resistance protein